MSCIPNPNKGTEFHLIRSRQGHRPSWLNQGIFHKIEQDNCFTVQQILIVYCFHNKKNFSCMLKTPKAMSYRKHGVQIESCFILHALPRSEKLRTSLDVGKQNFSFSGDSTWPPHDKGLWLRAHKNIARRTSIYGRSLCNRLKVIYNSN